MSSAFHAGSAGFPESTGKINIDSWLMQNNKILYMHDWFTLNFRGTRTNVRPQETLEKKVV